MRLLCFSLANYKVCENKGMNFDSWVRFEYSPRGLKYVKNDLGKVEEFLLLSVYDGEK